MVPALVSPKLLLPTLILQLWKARFNVTLDLPYSVDILSGTAHKILAQQSKLERFVPSGPPSLDKRTKGLLV